MDNYPIRADNKRRGSDTSPSDVSPAVWEEPVSFVGHPVEDRVESGKQSKVRLLENLLFPGMYLF